MNQRYAAMLLFPTFWRVKILKSTTSFGNLHVSASCDDETFFEVTDLLHGHVRWTKEQRTWHTKPQDSRRVSVSMKIIKYHNIIQYIQYDKKWNRNDKRNKDWPRSKSLSQTVKHWVNWIHRIWGLWDFYEILQGVCIASVISLSHFLAWNTLKTHRLIDLKRYRLCDIKENQLPSSSQCF